MPLKGWGTAETEPTKQEVIAGVRAVVKVMRDNDLTLDHYSQGYDDDDGETYASYVEDMLIALGVKDWWVDMEMGFDHSYLVARRSLGEDGPFARTESIETPSPLSNANLGDALTDLRVMVHFAAMLKGRSAT